MTVKVWNRDSFMLVQMKNNILIFKDSLELPYESQHTFIMQSYIHAPESLQLL